MKIEITNEIREFVDLFADLYREQLADHNSSGELSMFKTKIKVQNNHFLLQFELPKYWEYLENGTKPHFPPINEIESWIRIKPIIPDSQNGKIPTTKQLAFMIQSSIARTEEEAIKKGKKIGGTKGYHPLEKALNQPQASILVEQIKEELATQIKQKIYDKYFKTSK